MVCGLPPWNTLPTHQIKLNLTLSYLDSFAMKFENISFSRMQYIRMLPLTWVQKEICTRPKAAWGLVSVVELQQMPPAQEETCTCPSLIIGLHAIFMLPETIVV